MGARVLKNANIVLAGFMATGKTCVGEEIARLTGFPFIDTDKILEERFGLTVPDIFSKHGEERFREEEKKLAVELSQEQNTVIATGGGMIVDPDSRCALEGSGELFCLSASLETIAARVEHTSHRPLMQGETRTKKIAALLESRNKYYLNIDNQVNTDELSPVEIAVDIIGRLSRSTRRVRVATEDGIDYPIFVGAGVVEELPRLLAAAEQGRRVYVVTDSNVHAIHSRRFADILQSAGYTPDWFVFPAGEKSKTTETVSGIYSFLADRSAQKDSYLIAFGGGVVGDTAGLAASTYMRGIPLIHVPTTLMAQADSSIGSKNAVNRPEAKNLVGTFFHPEIVLSDPDYLLTLPDCEFRSGFAEVVKTAIIEGEDAFRALEVLADPIQKREAAYLEPVIFRCIRQKTDIVSRDPYEKNERRVLNLGHTFGHAIEQWHGYTGISHGEAVALGIRTATFVSHRLGKITASESDRICNLMDRAGLLENAPDEAEKNRGLLRAMVLDKKARKGKLVFVIPTKIGGIEIIEDVDPEELEGLLEEINEKDTGHTRSEPEEIGKKGA